MTTVVIMPGGFHPFHAGHLSLYQSAVRAFPDADVYVAATADTSTRPFPFAIKKNLAKLAGVPEDRFVQVKSPFSAEEITSKYDPQRDVVIFVRSDKDRGSQPQPGRVKKDGTPGYLQPLTRQPEPFGRHAYMTYLPTVEFASGLTSASEIRSAWPSMTDRQKMAMIKNMYPRTKANPQLAGVTMGLLDQAMLREEELSPLSEQSDPIVDLTPNYPNYEKLLGQFVGVRGKNLQFRIVKAELRPGSGHTDKIARVMANGGFLEIPPNFVKRRPVVGENQGWAATFTSEEQRTGAGQQGAGMTAGYQRRENQPIDETLSDKNLAALSQAKEKIAQDRQEEIEAWTADVKRNFEKYNRSMVRPSTPVAATAAVAGPDTKETLPALKQRLNNLNQALEKIAKLEKIVTRLDRARPSRMTPNLQYWANIDHLIDAAPQDNYQTLNQHLDQALEILGARLQQYLAAYGLAKESQQVQEKWSEKYKRSINCTSPRGFSQRAHCAGRKK